MHQLRCSLVPLALLLILLAAEVPAKERKAGDPVDDDDEGAFADFEDKDEKDLSGTTTTSSRLQRHELPEDGFVWPTTDEEHFADTLSADHVCNGCRAVAHQINKALEALMPAPPAGRRKLAEHEYTEAMECRTKIYDDYGLKKLWDRSRVLVGPGLEHTDKEGSVFGGAKWPTRIARFCGNLVGDIGEEEVYNSWTKHTSNETWTDEFCLPSCGGAKRVVKEEPEEEAPVKKKRKKVEKKKEDPITGPPSVVKIYDKKEIKKLAKKNRFVFLLFCAPSFARCKSLEEQWELAARAVKKTDDLKDSIFALANTDKVGTFDYELAQGVLPAFLLFRKGYIAPKGISPEEMLRLKEKGDFLNYLQLEVANYMQDDPDSYPRGKFEL